MAGHRSRLALGIGAVILIASLLALPSVSTGAQAGTRFFPQTGKTVSGRFLQYWNANGGVTQQGLPISEEMQERSDTDGNVYTVQYFERAVFEYHPENERPFDVLLSLLGTFLYAEKYPDEAPGQEPDTSAGSVLFPETGKRVGGKFLQYWREHGGLAQQGYPISDEFTEVSDLNGEPYTVQYFERAVFEMHPENQPPHDVLLSQLGTFRYRSKYPVLPASDARVLDQVVENERLEGVQTDWANTVIYALPNAGAAMLLTPPTLSFPARARDLAGTNQVIGTLVVVQSVNSSLPPDHYVLTISSGGSEVIFTGMSNNASFSSVFRQLQTPFTHPTALITARQMCIGWNTTQVCAIVDLPPTEDITGPLFNAVEQLQMSPEDVSIELSIPDIEGKEGLERCARALSARQPVYEDCVPTMLAAPRAPAAAPAGRQVPGSRFGARDPLRGSGLASYGIQRSNVQTEPLSAVISALESIEGNIYADEDLKNSVGVLPGGPYAMYGVPRGSDPPVPGRNFRSRMGVFGPGSDDDFYVEAYREYQALGVPIEGVGPPADDEMVILNMVILNRWCINWFGNRECDAFN